MDDRGRGAPGTPSGARHAARGDSIIGARRQEPGGRPGSAPFPGAEIPERNSGVSTQPSHAWLVRTSWGLRRRPPAGQQSPSSADSSSTCPSGPRHTVTRAATAALAQN